MSQSEVWSSFGPGRILKSNNVVIGKIYQDFVSFDAFSVGLYSKETSLGLSVTVPCHG